METFLLLFTSEENPEWIIFLDNRHVWCSSGVKNCLNALLLNSHPWTIITVFSFDPFFYLFVPDKIISTFTNTHQTYQFFAGIWYFLSFKWRNLFTMRYAKEKLTLFSHIASCSSLIKDSISVIHATDLEVIVCTELFFSSIKIFYIFYNVWHAYI